MQLDERPLLFDHDDRLETLHELVHHARFEGVRHAELEDAHAGCPEFRLADAEQPQGGHQVGVALAGRRDPDAIRVMPHRDPVQSVRSREFARRVQAMLVDLGFQIEAVGNHEHHAERLPIRLPVDQHLGNLYRTSLRAELDNPASVANVRRQLEAAPRAAES